MSREELLQLKKVELKAMCKERNIPVYKGKNLITNVEMVDKIIEYDAETTVNDDPVVEKTVTEETEKPVEKPVEKKHVYIRRPVNPVISPDKVKSLNDQIENSERTPWVMGNKDDVINRADAGTLIAFLDDNGKPRTAKLVHRSASRRMLQLVTEYEWEFTVSYDNVLWVRNSSRWPKAIYLMLKEYRNGRPVSVTYEKQDQ